MRSTKPEARRPRRLDSAPTSTGSRLNIALDVDGKDRRDRVLGHAQKCGAVGPVLGRDAKPELHSGRCLRMLATSRRCIGNGESAGLSPD